MFKDKVKALPTNPGVYIMHDERDEIIYVGKAKNLKNRVSQYFQSKNHLPKVAAMVANVARFEYIITDSEFEALVLECNLIKKHRPNIPSLSNISPRYNILTHNENSVNFLL